MKKKVKENFLRIKENLSKKKYFHIEQNKNQLMNLPYKFNLYKEEKKIDNKDKNNKYYNEQKRINSNKNKIEDVDNSFGFYDSNIMVNGLVNNEVENIKYNNVYKTINNQKKIKKFIKNNSNNRNDNLTFKNDKNHNHRIMNYFESNNLNDNKNIVIDLKGNIIAHNRDDENGSFFDKNHKLIKNNYEKTFISLKNYENEKQRTPNNFEYNNLDNSITNISSLSPKLYFDYKRISNLLVNNSIENYSTINRRNNNLFRKKKIKITDNNTNNLYTTLGYRQKKEQKTLFKNASFNNNKKLINNEGNSDDIPINIKKSETKDNLSSIVLSNWNNNNSNVIERNYNLFFSPSSSNNPINKYNSFNPSSKPFFGTTENTNFFSSSQYSINSKKKYKTLNTKNRKNRNFNVFNNFDFNTNSNNDKYYSAINVLNKKEKIDTNKNDNNEKKIPIARSMKNVGEKRKIFRKKNNSFNNFNHMNYSQIKSNRLSNQKDLNDDIFIYKKNNINNKIKGEKKQVISDYYSSYIQNENTKKRRIFCFNNFGSDNENYDNNNNNKINIKKRKYIENNQNESTSNDSINDDNKINYIINKYKNNSIVNSRQTKNKKLKNLIFSYERLFKQKTSTVNKKFKKNKFLTNYENKDDINYKKSTNKKIRIKYLTPNTTKTKNQINFMLDREKNNNQIKELNYVGKTEYENNNVLPNEKNLEFDLNIDQSKSILNNIQYENSISNNCFKKVKDFLKNKFPSRKENKNNKKKLINSISNREKNKLLNIFKNIENNKEKEVGINSNNFENSNNNNSTEYNDNIPHILDKKNNKKYMNNYYKENNIDEFSDSNKENYEYNLNLDMNNEYFKKTKKPIIINSQSCIYDNYGYNKYKGINKKGFKKNDYILNNKTINNCSKRDKNILRNKSQNKSYKNKRRKYNCNCGKENINNNIEEMTHNSKKLLLVTDITKCPKCHCLFGNSSKFLQNKK